MWHGQTVLANYAARESFFEFLAAPKGDPAHRIETVFLAEVDPGDEASRKPIGDLVEQCHQRGIRVDFLCGDPSYAEPDKNSVGLAFVDKVLQYNAKEPKSRRFDGFQFDVEPYLLPGWPTPGLRTGFLGLLQESEDKIRKSGGGMQMGSAIPRWFDAPDLDGLYKEVLNRVDYVAVMDYVDTSERFVHDGANTVNYATQIGKSVWLGAEATALPTEPMATFYSRGNGPLEAAFSAAGKAFGNQRGFAGVAIEYYESYVALRP